MQIDSAYMDQIPPGAKPAPAAPAPLKIRPAAPGSAPRPVPPGLYVQFAGAASQEQALRAGMDLVQRLGSDRPPFVRAEVVAVAGRPQLMMYAGPFEDEGAARRFCGLALPDQACITRVFASGSADPASRNGKPEAAAPPPKRG